jgi:F0F1-type ATP synthase delta subunit
LSRQLSDPTLGLRGKRNIISEIMSEKSPSQATVETLEKLMEGYEERLGQNLEEIVSQQEDVEKVLSEDKEKKGATIDKINQDTSNESVQNLRVSKRDTKY